VWPPASLAFVRALRTLSLQSSELNEQSSEMSGFRQRFLTQTRVSGRRPERWRRARSDLADQDRMYAVRHTSGILPLALLPEVRQICSGFAASLRRVGDARTTSARAIGRGCAAGRRCFGEALAGCVRQFGGRRRRLALSRASCVVSFGGGPGVLAEDVRRPRTGNRAKGVT
jgi:hypothetical protein